MSSRQLPGFGWYQEALDGTWDPGQTDGIIDYMKNQLKIDITPGQMDVMQNIKDYMEKNPIDRLQTLPFVPCVTVRPSGPASYAASFDERMIGTPHPAEDLIAEYEITVETMARLVEAHPDGQRCMNSYVASKRPCRICRDKFDNEWAWYHTTILLEALEAEFLEHARTMAVLKPLLQGPPEDFNPDNGDDPEKWSDYKKMMNGIRPEYCTCEMYRDKYQPANGDPPEPAEWVQDHDCPRHGDTK